MQSPYFEYVKIDNIHRFNMYRADHDAVEAYFSVKHEILESLEDGSLCLIVLDFTKTGLPPTDFTIAKSVQMMRRFKIKQPHRAIIISHDTSEAQLAETKFKMNPFLHVKYIKPEEEDAYMDWLLTGQSA